MVVRRRPDPSAAHLAGAYIRISDPRKQGDNHSPEVQREGIRRLAQQLGYIIAQWEQDEERGRIVTRGGYLRLLEACRAGQLGAILVFSLSRWGRKASERLERGDELDRLGITLYSVQQGADEAGIVRGVQAVVDEEASRQLARNIRPAREAGARHGTHQGPTPYGYQRRYPAWEGPGKRPPGELVPDPVAAPIVREMFARYDTGGDSLRTLARWLNDEVRARSPRALESGRPWCNQGVRSILCNVTYTGQIGFNARPRGVYAAAEPEDRFVAPGRHEALVSAELYERVQARMRAMGRQPSRVRTAPTLLTGGEKRTRTLRTHLATGLLLCRGCGGRMHPHWQPHTAGHKGSYLCRGARIGSAGCREPGYRMDLAHAALIAAVARLRGSPWTPRAAGRISGGDIKRRDEVRRIARALDDERARLVRHTRALTLLGDPTPAQVTAYRTVSAEIDARIAALEAQKAATASGAHQGRLPDLQALHAELTRTELRDVLATLDWAEDDVDRQIVRSLLQKTVEAATVVDRGPGRSARWLRLEVTWTAGVRALLEAGLLRLEPDPPTH